MNIGIPKESWKDERRVALTPGGVHALVRAGHKVFVQENAGVGSGFSREAYEEAGAIIAFSAEEVFSRASMIVKIMPPTLQESHWMGADRFLFSWLQLGALNPVVLNEFMEANVTAVGYELIEDDRHNLPVLTTMSEIAGLLLPQIAGRFLETTEGGRGISLGGVAGIPASTVVIVGAGVAGTSAARSFLGAGANVMVLDSDLQRLRAIEDSVHGKVNTAIATSYNLERSVEFADVLVGAVLIRGRKTPHVITEDMVRSMKSGSVIIDVSIDQGGCVETSRPTTLSDPVFVQHGVIHYCVPNIASSVARTASHALNNVVLPYIEEVANGRSAAFARNEFLRRSAYVYQRRCTIEELTALMEQEGEGAKRMQ